MPLALRSVIILPLNNINLVLQCQSLMALWAMKLAKKKRYEQKILDILS